RHAHSPLHSILFLHRTVGNQAVEKLIRSGVIQAKLTIGQQEPHRIQRMCTECEQELHGQPMEEKVVQAKDTLENKPEVTPTTESQTHGRRNGGQPLFESVRPFFEPRFGQQFGQGRLPTDAPASKSATKVNALAYTVGSDVVFGRGQYSPET